MIIRLRCPAVLEFLAQHGFAAVALDAQGHGHSEPHPPSIERAAIRDFNDIVADAAQHILEHVVPFRQQHSPDAKIFLAGSSMGGAVVRATRCASLRVTYYLRGCKRTPPSHPHVCRRCCWRRGPTSSSCRALAA